MQFHPAVIRYVQRKLAKYTTLPQFQRALAHAEAGHVWFAADGCHIEVASQSRAGRVYPIDARVPFLLRTCRCAHYRDHRQVCVHLIAASLLIAETAFECAAYTGQYAEQASTAIAEASVDTGDLTPEEEAEICQLLAEDYAQHQAEREEAELLARLCFDEYDSDFGDYNGPLWSPQDLCWPAPTTKEAGHDR